MNLTPRELEVLEAVNTGARSYYEIAAALEPQISPRTAEAHVARIYEKLSAAEGPAESTPLMAVIVYVRLSYPGHDRPTESHAV